MSIRLGGIVPGGKIPHVRYLKPTISNRFRVVLTLRTHSARSQVADALEDTLDNGWFVAEVVRSERTVKPINVVQLVQLVGQRLVGGGTQIARHRCQMTGRTDAILIEHGGGKHEPDRFLKREQYRFALGEQFHRFIACK
uniref:Uncharacterized protein n=1 Tax=Anopheles culicifacies TaxID=139723 RepID=A0A182LRJ9_9DIPT